MFENGAKMAGFPHFCPKNHKKRRFSLKCM
jgi:hypothetical protein